MNETLTCVSCSSNWQREKSRGRKPQLCPICASEPNTSTVDSSSPNGLVKKKTSSEKFPDLTVAKVVSSIIPRYSKAEELAEQTKNGSQWKCPTCSHVLKMLLPVTAPPTHKCTPNTVTSKICERIK